MFDIFPQDTDSDGETSTSSATYVRVQLRDVSID